MRRAIFNKAPFLDEWGELAGLIGVISDITEQKLAEERIKLNEARLESMVHILQHNFYSL